MSTRRMVLTDTTWWGIHLISRSLDYLVVFPGLARFRGPRIRVLNQTETPVRVLLVFHQSGSPGGRPRVLADVQDLARQRTGDAIETLAKIMANEKAPLRRASRLPRCCSIAAGYVKPLQPIAQTLAGSIRRHSMTTSLRSRAGEMPRRTRHPPCNR